MTYSEKLRQRATKNRTSVEAVAWLDERLTGSTKAAMRHQMTATPEQTVAEMRLRSELLAS